MRILGLGLAFAGAVIAAKNPADVTFNKDVLPVLQSHCQGCHRPGEVAPFSFLTYKETRPLAKSIREAVLSKKMPPWFADPHYGKFSNDRSLAKADVDTLVAWADNGAREGDPKDAPAPRQFVTGWSIGQPDLVIEMPNEYQVQASGTIAYQYVVIPTGLTEDKYVQMAEVRPGNRALVHHVIAFIREPGSKWLQDAQPGVPVNPRRGGGNGEFLVGYAPGSVPEILKPNQGKLIKAGSDIVFQLHYTANGKPGTDQSRIGLIFTKQLPTERVVTLAVSTKNFVIPPGEANLEVNAKLTLYDSARLIAFFPHMHLRGKDFEYRIVRPAGEKEILLRVPRYDFGWQLSYYSEKDIPLTFGTVMEVTAHFDNSVNNKANPDATKEVRWGDQSWEEMMIGFFDVAIDIHQKPTDLVKEKKPAATGD